MINESGEAVTIDQDAPQEINDSPIDIQLEFSKDVGVQVNL
jgi:hypothetical protein